MGLFDIFGGSKKTSAKSKTGRNIAQAAKATRANYPALLDTLVGAINAQTPRYAGQLLDTYSNFIPEVSRISAETDLGLLRGLGRDITAETLAQMKLADPEYFLTRTLLSSKAGDLLGGQDPNRLTGAELANVERGLNQINPNYAGSNTATLSNALVFGDRLNQKRALLSDTLGQVGSMLNSFRTPAFNYEASTGQKGQDLFGNVTDLTGQGFGIGSNLLGQSSAINMNERNIQAEKVPGWERIVGALPDYS